MWTLTTKNTILFCSFYMDHLLHVYIYIYIKTYMQANIYVRFCKHIT
jgi:DNA-directed RNA polymerase subunit L